MPLLQADLVAHVADPQQQEEHRQHRTDRTRGGGQALRHRLRLALGNDGDIRTRITTSPNADAV